MEHITEGSEDHRPAVDDALVERYIVGDCSSAERETVDAWIRQQPDDGNVVRWLRGRLQDSIAPTPAGADAGRAYAEFTRRTEQNGAALATPKNRTPENVRLTDRLKRSSLIRAVISLSVLAIAGASAYFGLRTSPPAGFPARIYATGAGQQTTVQLPDGSRVMLAPHTTLVVGGTGATRRTVQLTGEAYFDVKPVPGAPFVVQTGSIRTQVLGTVFTVRHYEHDREVTVAVRSGRVSSGRHKPFILSENMVARITDSTAVINTDADLSEYTEWTKGRLVFHMTPVSQVLAAVGHWYGYELRLSDSTLAQEPVVTMLNGHSAPDALATLRSLLNVDMTFNGHIVTLHPKRRATPSPRNRGDVQDSFPPLSEVGR